MSKFVNGGTRTKTARETYVEQLRYGRGSTNKKRETFTSLNPSNNSDFAYRSTPNYLREIAQQNSLSPTEIMSARNIPRTRSASELTPRNNLNRSMTGNPKYKAQEDYYDEIQTLKKDMKTVKDDNSNLRAKIRRLEEDNARKRKEIDALYDSSKDGDIRRTVSGSSTDRNNNNNASTANVVMSLKQRLFKLELQLKQKETVIDELKSDPRWTKSTELEIQNRALFGEVQREKVERLNYIQQNDYMASIDEEKKNVVRKLNREKDDLQKENESLKRKVRELEKSDHSERLSARPLDDNNDKELFKKSEDFKHMKRELDQMNEKLDEIKRERDQYKRKSEKVNEHIEEIERDRDQYRKKFERANENLEEIKRDRDQYKKKLDQANEDLEQERNKQIKSNQTGRSSPAFKRDEEQHQNSVRASSTSFKRPQSPSDEKRTPRSSTTNVHRDSHSPEEFRKTESKPTHSPPLSTSKFDHVGSDNPKNRPSSANTSNESALKTVQASLRGHLNRSEIDKTPDQIPSKGRTSTSTEKLKSVESEDEDDDMGPIKSKQSASPYESGKKRDSLVDQPKSNSKTSLPNNNIGSNSRLPLNNRDLSSKTFGSPTPPVDYQRPLSPQIGSAGGSKQNLPNDRNKLGSKSPIPTRDRDLSSKLRQSPPPMTDTQRPLSPPIGSAGGSKQNLPNDRNKIGSNSPIPTRDRDLSSKLRQSPPPMTDRQRPVSPQIGSAGGSKQNLPNDRNKLGSNSPIPTRDRDLSSKLRQSPPPMTDTQRPSSPLVGSGGGSKQNLPNDRNKLGSNNRFTPRDQDLSSKVQRPSSPSNTRQSSEFPQPPSRKSPTNSKSSLKNIPNDDDDDDVVVV